MMEDHSLLSVLNLHITQSFLMRLQRPTMDDTGGTGPPSRISSTSQRVSVDVAPFAQRVTARRPADSSSLRHTTKLDRKRVGIMTGRPEDDHHV
jgi:hypothetical protein